MKKLLIIAIAFVAQNSFAQVTKNLGDFSDLKVYDKLTVQLIKGSENKVIITGKRESEVEVVNKNGELKLRMPFPKLLSGDDITIKLYYKNIESIAANEGSNVTSNVVFKQTIMDVSAREGSEVNIDIDVNKVNVNAVTGGIVELSGKAQNQDVSITSGGILRAKDLETGQTKVTVSAGGNAEVKASTLVEAKVKAGGTINIFGKPKQINQKTILGGTIVEKE